MLYLDISSQQAFHFYFSMSPTLDLYIEEKASLHKFIYAALAQKRICVFTRAKNTEIKLRSDKHIHFEKDFLIINFSLKNKFRNKLKDSTISNYDILTSCLKNLE